MAAGTVTLGIADRLGSTMFLAALAHGVVILGVTFTTSPLGDSDELPALNVTLLVDTQTAERADPDTDFLASRDARGGGRPDDDAFRPTTALAADHPLSLQGSPLGADPVDGTPRQAAPEADRLVTRSATDRRVEAVPEATESPAPVPMSAAQLIEQEAPATLAAEIDDEARSPESDNDSALTSPSARQAAIAEYLVGWRRRVERIGTSNFPREFLSARDDHGRPVLEVAIDASGGVEEIVVRRSSGDAALDTAALKILRMAAPFQALPPEVLAETEILRFAYEWDFSTGSRPGARTSGVASKPTTPD